MLNKFSQSKPNMGTTAGRIIISPMEKKDIRAAAVICYEGFGVLHERYLGRRVDFPSVDIPLWIMEYSLSDPKVTQAIWWEDCKLLAEPCLLLLSFSFFFFCTISNRFILWWLNLMMVRSLDPTS